MRIWICRSAETTKAASKRGHQQLLLNLLSQVSGSIDRPIGTTHSLTVRHVNSGMARVGCDESVPLVLSCLTRPVLVCESPEGQGQSWLLDAPRAPPVCPKEALESEGTRNQYCPVPFLPIAGPEYVLMLELGHPEEGFGNTMLIEQAVFFSFGSSYDCC